MEVMFVMGLRENDFRDNVKMCKLEMYTNEYMHVMTTNEDA